MFVPRFAGPICLGARIHGKGGELVYGYKKVNEKKIKNCQFTGLRTTTIISTLTKI